MDKSVIRLIAISVSFLAYQQSIQANGFRLPEYTAAGVATSNALVADSSRISAVAYNPAVMSVYSSENNKKLLSLNYMNVQYDTEVSAGSTTTQGTGNSSFDIPSFFVSTPLSDKLSFGILLHSPFGLETNWPASTFASFGGNANLDPALSRIKMYNANFNLGYKLSSNTGIAFGLNQYRLLDLRFNTQATEIKGNSTGYGWNAALITKFSPTVSLGVSYRSSVDSRAVGTASGVLPVYLDITFPEMLSIGMNFSITKSLKLEVDIEHTGWKVFDAIRVNRIDNNANVTTSTNNWQNTLTYRASGQYKINKHQILFGYTYDETPQGDSNYSARIPDSDRQLFSIGYLYDFGTFNIETGLMLVKFNDRTINSSTAYTAGQDPNGTVAYNGTYRSNATVISIGVNTSF